MAERGATKHFMLKEIHEQPRASRTRAGPRGPSGGRRSRGGIGLDAEIARARRVYLMRAARATTRPWRPDWNRAAGPRARGHRLGSEVRYRKSRLRQTESGVAVSQSGETAIRSPPSRRPRGGPKYWRSATCSSASRAHRTALSTRMPVPRSAWRRPMLHDAVDGALGSGRLPRPPPRHAYRRSRSSVLQALVETSSNMRECSPEPPRAGDRAPLPHRARHAVFGRASAIRSLSRRAQLKEIA